MRFHIESLARRVRRVSAAAVLAVGAAVQAWGAPAGAANAEYALKRARQLQQNREYAASSKLLDRYVDAPGAETADTALLIDLLRAQGDNFYYLGVPTRAADLYGQALKIAEATGRKRKIAELCNELFVIHLNSGNPTLSNDLLSRSLEIYRALGDTVNQCKVLNNIGILRYKEGDMPGSLDYYGRSMELAGTDSARLAAITTNMAESYARLGDYRKADAYLDRAVSLVGRRYDSSDALQSWLNKAGVQATLGNRANARAILRDVGRNMALTDADRLVESFGRMAHIYFEIGDSIEGLRCMLAAQAFTDSLHREEEHNQLREVLIRYNAERVEEHNRMLELNVRRHTQFNYVLGALVLTALCFAGFLIFRLRADRRKNRLIRLQKERLMEYERREHDRREKEMARELDYKNRQLTAYSIDAASISELHKIMMDSLRKLRTSVPQRGGDKEREAVSAEINDIIGRLQNFNRKEVHEDFRVYFNEVHPDFTKRLSARFPVLTANDLRLCSYLYLGMSTKEIAALTFREIRSVESSRLRLRKKMGVPAEVSLHDFLLPFGQ